MTPAEMLAARKFRAEQRAALERKNDAEPPDIIVSVFVHFYRHECDRQDGKSVALELKEHYAYSPEYAVYGGDAEGWRVCPVSPEALDVAADHSLLRPRRFGWIWVEGRCPACGMVARSRRGRLVDPVERPPDRRALIA